MPGPITPEQITSGRATLRIPNEHKVEILHAAGFPFIEDDPNARLHKGQVEVILAPERYKIVNGGSGWGKSISAAAEAFLELLIPGHKVAIIGQTYDMTAPEFEYVYKAFMNMFGRAAAVSMKFRTEQKYWVCFIKTVWGSEVTCFQVGSDEGLQMMGKEFDLVIAGEGSRIPMGTWETSIYRSLDRRMKRLTSGYVKETGRLACYTTPRGFEGMSAGIWENITAVTGETPESLSLQKAMESEPFRGGLRLGQPHPVTERPVSWVESVFLRQCRRDENPIFTKEQMEAAKNSLSEDRFREQYLGEMVFRSGLVFKEFDKQRHLVPCPGPEEIARMRLGIGIDTGNNFAAVLVGLDRNTRLWVLGEARINEGTTKDNTDAIKRMLVQKLGPLRGMSGGVENLEEQYREVKQLLSLIYADSASQHKFDLAESLGEFPQSWKPDLLDTINSVRDLFASDMLYISDDCQEIVKELGKIIWEVKKTPQLDNSPTIIRPKEGNDHLVDSLRFIFDPLLRQGVTKDDAIPVTMIKAFEQNLRNEIVHNQSNNGAGVADKWAEELYQL